MSDQNMDTDDLIGKELGHCRIQRKIGQGGMGAVYLAHHPGLNKAVAIKVLPGDLATTPEFKERFIREARLAARLEHPNVVQVFDVGDELGVHYISMQYIEGKSLDSWLKERKKLTVPEALSTAKRIAVALSAAAKLGIVHRDIKPHNILISKDGVVKVADFGLAKDEDSNRSISEPGVVMGTPYYMSPEQAKGEKVDHRSDLYSLGATLYHMLTGKRLYDGGSPVTIVLKQQGDEAPIPARQLEPTIPEAVDALLTRLLQKDPAKRFQTADEVLRALDALKQPGPASAVTSAPPKRKAAIVALPIAGILVVGIVLGLILGRGGKTPPPAPAAPIPAPVVRAPEPPKPVEKPVEKPAEKPPAEAPPREKILARMKDITEKRLTEEVMARAEELMKAMKARDTKTIRGMLDEVAFGQMTDGQVLETFGRNQAEKQLESWEFQDVEVRMRIPGARPQPHAVTTMAFELTFPKGSMKIQDQLIQWIRKSDGKWYVTKFPKSGK